MHYWKLNQIVMIFFQDNTFENVVCKIAAICLSLNMSLSLHTYCIVPLRRSGRIFLYTMYHINYALCLDVARFWCGCIVVLHDDVMTSKRFPHCLPFVRGIHRSPVDSPRKGAVIRSFDAFFIFRSKELFNKQSSGRWFEMPWRSCDCNVVKLCVICLPISIRVTSPAVGQLRDCDWDEITNPFPNFNGAVVEVWEWISNFTPHFIGYVITYPYWDRS